MAEKMHILTTDEACGVLSAISNVRNGIRALSEVIKPGQRYLTDSELSKELNISRRTLANYRAKGEFGFYNLPGKILYAEAEIEDYMRKHYIPPFS